MPARSSPRPKGLFRRMERFIMGVVMSFMAFVLEKMVMRSIRRDGGDPKPSVTDPTSITTKGGAIDFEPDH